MGLSPRMLEVVELVGRDHASYEAVGRRLGISARTVETYARQIRDRTNVGMNPRDAVLWYYWHVYRHDRAA